MGYPYQESITSSGWNPGLDANSTGSPAFPVATITEPATDATTLIIPCQNAYVELMFHGTDAANEVGVAEIVLWSRLHEADGDTTDLWVPEAAALLTITLGTKKGVAATSMDADQFIADTIVLTTGDTAASPEVVTVNSPTGDKNATARIRTNGRQLLGVYLNPGTAASLNCIWRTR